MPPFSVRAVVLSMMLVLMACTPTPEKICRQNNSQEVNPLLSQLLKIRLSLKRIKSEIAGASEVVSAANLNLARGYTIHSQDQFYQYTGLCYDKLTAKNYICPIQASRKIETPVPINHDEERKRRRTAHLIVKQQTYQLKLLQAKSSEIKPKLSKARERREIAVKQCLMENSE